MYNSENFNRNVGLKSYQQDASPGIGQHDGQDDLNFLASYHAVNQSVIGAFFGMVFLIILLVSLVSLVFGFFIFWNLPDWGIASVIAVLTIVVLGPLSIRLRNWTDHKNYEYWLYITKDWLFCAKAPKHYRKQADYAEFLRNQSGQQSYGDFANALHNLQSNARAQSQENFLNGITVHCLSRHFRIFTTNKHIELWDGKHQAYLPYDSGAVAFLKDIALLSDVAYANKTEETKHHGIHFRELASIAFGLLAGYAFQLFAMFTAYSGGGDFSFTRAEIFMPSLPIMAVPAIFFTWLAFGFAQVRWKRLWCKISTVLVLGFGVPFALISMGAVFLQPSLLHQPYFYIIAAGISFACMLGIGVPTSRKVV